MRSRLAAPLLSGILLAAATPPALAPVLPFVALVPLALHLARLPSGARAFESGAIAAAIQHAWGLRWLPGTLTAVAGPATGWAAALAVLLTLAAFGGAAAWCVARLLGARASALAPPARARAYSAGGVAVALPLVWTALDWTLAHLPLGLAFPWAPLGLGLARWPVTLGLAELVGVTGVTAWLALVNGLLAAALLAWSVGDPTRRARAAALAAAAATGAIGPIGWGWWRVPGIESYPVVPVVALALDVAPEDRPEARAEAAVTATERAAGAITDETALIVLPEMALPLDADSAAAASFVARLRAVGDRVGAPVLVGARTTRAGRAFNSAVLLAEPSFRGEKSRLVPGAERGSALAPAWLAPVVGGYAQGADRALLEVGGLSAGVLICYEVAFADDARGLARAGAQTLLVLSNDAWFGGADARSGGRAAGVAQQLAHLTLRAIETGRTAVRSANGGPAAEIDAAGRRRTLEPPGALVALVPPAHESLFVRTGDRVGPLALVALLLALVGTSLAHPSIGESKRIPGSEEV